MTLEELKTLMNRIIKDINNLEKVEITFMQYDACDEKAIFDVYDAFGNEKRYTYTIAELLEE